MPERTVFESVCHRHVVSVAPGASAQEAACVMSRNNCSSVLVIDNHGALLGIVSERDLVLRVVAKALDPHATPVCDVMTHHPHTVAPETKVSDALWIMLDRGFQNLPIVTSAARVLGVFSERDALPREVGDAVSLAEFADQVNDALA